MCKILKIKWLEIYSILVFVSLSSCTKKAEIPSHYDGYAILQTKALPDDGLSLYTFYFLVKDDKESLEEDLDADKNLMNKSVTFIFTQGTHYLKYKKELNNRNWNDDNDLILVKINYNILIPEWKEYTKIGSKKITIENKVYTIEDYDFYNLVNNKGELLYKINDIEFIKKIN